MTVRLSGTRPEAQLRWVLGMAEALAAIDRRGTVTCVMSQFMFTQERARAKCIGQIVKAQRSITAGTVAEFGKHLKASSKAKPSQVVLSLLVVGEIGRFMWVCSDFL